MDKQKYEHATARYGIAHLRSGDLFDAELQTDTYIHTFDIEAAGSTVYQFALMLKDMGWSHLSIESANTENYNGYIVHLYREKE